MRLAEFILLAGFVMYCGAADVGGTGAKAETREKTVYQSIGGIAVLAQVADSVCSGIAKDEGLLGNAKIQTVFSSAQVSAFKYHLTSALCQLAGGPERYTGTPVPQLIKDYGITEKEWSAGAALLEKVLAEQKVGELERKELTGRILAVWKTIADQEARTYRNKENGFSILLPAGWEKQESAKGTVLIAASAQKDEKDLFRENINVHVEELPLDMTTAEYTKATVLGAAKQLKGFKVIESVRADLGGGTAEVLVYTYKTGALPMATTSYFFVKGRRAVTVHCAAAEDQFQTFRPVFAESMRTFRLD